MRSAVLRLFDRARRILFYEPDDSSDKPKPVFDTPLRIIERLRGDILGGWADVWRTWLQGLVASLSGLMATSASRSAAPSTDTPPATLDFGSQSARITLVLGEHQPPPGLAKVLMIMESSLRNQSSGNAQP